MLWIVFLPKLVNNNATHSHLIRLAQYDLHIQGNRNGGEQHGPGAELRAQFKTNQLASKKVFSIRSLLQKINSFHRF
jgi:hypothetical protein